ncbi:MAG: OmpA family protein [Spirochaetes bacterium]|nr:OmpA family protein [Spirochaetota bacterium]
MSGKKKKQKCPEGTPDWMITFGDLNSLLLTFFVLLVSMAVFDRIEVQLILSAFQGSFGIMEGGNSLSSGILANIGETTESLPSSEAGRGMAKAIKEAVSMFQAEVKTRKVRVDINERGIIISLSSDAYFRRASAELDIDSARVVLEKVALLLQNPDLQGKTISIEGHTDDSPTDPYGPWPTNSHLGADRSLNVRNYLVDFGVNPTRMKVVSYGEYQPIMPNDTEEHRSKNRRVDIAILRDK